MANQLRNYNPKFYANQALIWLKKQLGMAGRVHRGYELERNQTFRKGQTINLRRPASFTVQDAPSTAQDVDTGDLVITLDKWKEVKFKLTDKELGYTGEQIIAEHIQPAAYSLAEYVDAQLLTLAAEVPWTNTFTQATATGAVLTKARRLMADNKVPQDGIARRHYMADPGTMEAWLNQAAFSQQQGAGDRGVATQSSGVMGPKYGFNLFETQNAQSVAGDTHTAATAVTVSGAHSKEGETLALTATTLTGTISKGQVIKVTTGGADYYYAVTADVAAAGNAATVSVSPKLRVAHSDADVVTFVTTHSAAYDAEVGFHRDAFALAVVPLPFELQRAAGGGQVYTQTDDVSGLAVRAQLYSMPDISEVRVKLDILFGIKTLNPDLAVRGIPT